jgi:hypothetical protein
MTRQELAAFVYESQGVLAEIEREMRDDSAPFGELYLSFADMGEAGNEVLDRVTHARVGLNQVGHLLEEFGIGESHLTAAVSPCFGSGSFPDGHNVCRKCNRVLSRCDA